MLAPDDRRVRWHVGNDVWVLAIWVKASVRQAPTRTNERLANFVDNTEFEICDRPWHEWQYGDEIDSNDQDRQRRQQSQHNESFSRGPDHLNQNLSRSSGLD